MGRSVTSECQKCHTWVTCSQVLEWPQTKERCEWCKTGQFQQMQREFATFSGWHLNYRHYVHQFLHVAAPLFNLTQKNVQFSWTSECQAAFSTLKQKITQAPILAYSQFDCEDPPFILQTDASAIGIGAVLEQDGHVVAYASRTLIKSERQYSVIQRECLAAVYGMKQFRHYLLGCSFKLVTDHAPLQWLSAQKMKGLLCRCH